MVYSRYQFDSTAELEHAKRMMSLRPEDPFDEKRFKKEYPDERTLCFKEHGDWEIWDMEPADVINLLIERLALSSREG